jgi:hypothetical protein
VLQATNRANPAFSCGVLDRSPHDLGKEDLCQRFLLATNCRLCPSPSAACQMSTVMWEREHGAKVNIQNDLLSIAAGW